MPRSSPRLGLALVLCSALRAAAGEPTPPTVPPIELRDGDRVVLLGGTLIEREAESGYLETRIARRYPGRSIVVRNLGWSGDTVDGASRARHNPAADGFGELVGHVAALKPTVIVLGYGGNEAFGGPAGLPAFAAGLDRLWAALAPTGARILVVTPPRQANLGPPLPDPAAHNADLARYGALLRAEAARRGAACVDLADLLPDRPPGSPHPETTNGLHLTPEGYRRASARIAPALGAAPGERPAVTVAADHAEAIGATVDGLAATPTGRKFRLVADFLPDPAGADADAEPLRIRAPGLAPGRYELRVDGRAVVAAAAADWDRGVAVEPDPDAAQVEALRERVVRKDLLYFHRWRPQNETYLFGMRKHEQGRNVAELAAFDPQIAAEEAEIVRLSRPAPHDCELARVPEGKVAR